MPGDMDLTKVNPFQGERRIDCRWDKADYEIACQVTNGSSSYEKQDSSGRMKASHCNRFFLVATPYGTSTALCQNEYANVDPTTRSAPAESTLKECDIDLLRNNMQEWQSWCSTSFSLCGQVDGVRRPLSMVVLSMAMKDYRDGRGDKCASNDEPHWILPVYFQAHNLEPNFQTLNRGRERLHVMGVLTPGPGLIPLRDKANLVPGRLSMGGGTQPLLASYDTLTLQAVQQTKCYQEVAPFFAWEGKPNYRTPNPAWQFLFLPSHFVALCKFV